MRRAVQLLVVAVAVGGILFLFVLPGRTWLSQSRAISGAEHRAWVLGQENQTLTQRDKQLHDPAFIEQTARSQYGLQMPGEKAYGITPTVASTTTVPPSNP